MPRMGAPEAPLTTSEGEARSQKATALEHRSISDNKRVTPSVVFMRRTAIEFLQIIFEKRPKDLFQYMEDDIVSEIQIQDAFTADLKTMGSQPSIIAKRGPVSWMGQGLGGSSVESRHMRSGNHVFNDLLMGNLTFNCISRQDIEAEAMAQVVMDSFRYFRPALQKYGFFSVKSLNMGDAALIEATGVDSRFFAVPVYLSAIVQERVSVTDTAPRELRKIIIEGIQLES